MSTGLTIIYNSFLYYICLVLLTHYILNCIPRKKVLIGTFLLFIPFSALAFLCDAHLLSPIYIAFQINHFFLLKLSFRSVKIRHLVFVYILLYCFNMIIISLFVPLAPELYNYIDVIVNTITSAFCLVICITKLQHKVQQILELTPKYIFIISAILLATAAAISAIISFFQQSAFPKIWNKFLPITTSLLLMTICVIVPIIFIISISNKQLKILTADYAQQIHIQAEHYKKLAEANYEVRRFQHDFKNIRIAIEKLLVQEKCDEALKLIRQCSVSLEHPMGIHSAFNTGNSIADALLTDKQNRAIVNNVQIHFQGTIPPYSLSPIDLCVILGNSLDNALDACEKFSSQGSKDIFVYCKNSGNYLFLTITNPIAEPVYIRNNRIVTTKENKTLHGFGLYSLHSVVKKYDGEIQLSATDNAFTINIDLDLMSTP